MNTWKDVPNLFANGKFKAQVSWGSGKKTIETVDAYFLNYSDEGESFGLGSHCMPLSFCTLIARPISDITDEEWMEMKGLPNFNENQIERRKKWFKVQVLTAEDLLYLLSIGVYPFSQTDFDNGTVIDDTTLRKNN